jgi:HEAT repeat protein
MARVWLTVPALASVSLAFAQQDARIQELVTKIKSEQGKLQGRYLSELGAMGEPAIGALTGLMSGEDKSVAFWAMQELVHIKSPRVLPTLLTRLERVEGTDRTSVFLAIGNHGNPLALDALVPLLRSAPDRFGAAYALGKIGDPDAIPHLERFFDDPSQQVRWQAKESVKWIRSIAAKFPDRLSRKQWWDGPDPTTA